MLNERATYLNQVLGKYTRSAVYDDGGKLLIPASYRITYDEVVLLDRYGIKLSDDDIQTIKSDFLVISKIIDQSTNQLKSLFTTMKRTKRIYVAPVQQKIIPLIHEASNNKHILHLYKALQPKDDYTYRHPVAVGVISNLIGKWLGLNHKELLELTTAAILHDVGKMMIPEEILNKPGKLTIEEFTTMKKHTTYGYDILKEIDELPEPQALVALQHHERIDGSGYPDGLREKDIDLFSQIVAVADVFHAMSSTKVYQNHFPFTKVMEEMEKDMFGGLNPKITITFIERTMQALIGHHVLLTDGRKGTILMVHPRNPKAPLIQGEEEYIDLNKEKNIKIEQIEL